MADGQERNTGLKRLLWFVGIWAAGVIALGLISLPIRALLGL